ncbi:hypothetical protein Q8A73_023749, partial [Channa argus]
PQEECVCQNNAIESGEGHRGLIPNEDAGIRPPEEVGLDLDSEGASEYEEGGGELMETQASELVLSENKKENNVNEIGSSLDLVLAEWSGEVASHPEEGERGMLQAPLSRLPIQGEPLPDPRGIALEIAVSTPQADGDESEAEMDFQQ